MMSVTIDREPEVVLLAQSGDRAAFGELVKCYQKRAYAIAYGFVGNREDALEMAQEAFVRAYRAMDRFDADRPFYPWLYQIVKNTCLNHLKRRKRRGETSLEGLAAAGIEFESGTPGPGERVALSELQRRIVDGMALLTEQHREILMLRHVHELSYAEIAACLGIPNGTVMSRLHGARQRLRQIMDEPS